VLLTISTTVPDRSASPSAEPPAADSRAISTARSAGPVTAIRLARQLGKPVDAPDTTALAFGTATVFFPEATPRRCTAALLVEVEADRLAALRRCSAAAVDGSSTHDWHAGAWILATAVDATFADARRRAARLDEAAARIPLPVEITVPALRCGPGSRREWRRLRRRGWAVSAQPIPLDDQRPHWGPSGCVRLTLAATTRVADALDELSRTLWALGARPSLGDRDPRRDDLSGDAGRVARIAALDEQRGGLEPADSVDAEGALGDDRWSPLQRRRIDAVLRALDEVGARSVIDLGCGTGDLLVALLARTRVARIGGMDVSATSLRRAAERIGVASGARASTLGRVTLMHGALTYADSRLRGYDAAVLMEVVEHLDLDRLPALEAVVFGAARPRAIVVTTPDTDYNVNYARFDGLRHPDHRFEWTGAEFFAWCERVADRHGYSVERRAIGDIGANGTSPTQAAVFVRAR
jgi:SAM-dependent methyltransferase